MKSFLIPALLCAAGLAPAAQISFDGSSVPSSPFTVVIFGGTSMNATGGELTLTTAPVQGVWFGFSGSAADANLGSSAEGNYVGIRAKLAPDADDWSMYLYDGTSYASFLFQSDAYEYSYAGPVGPMTSILPIDLTTFHDFEFWLQDGIVSYAVDGVLQYSGPAGSAAASKILVIGDGSGSTPTGTLSMTFDGATVFTGADYSLAPSIPDPAPVPEPSSYALMGAGIAGIGLFARRRR